MFSALKKLAGAKNENTSPIRNSNSHHMMSQNLQKKFAKGVHYNMKIIIKGDRSTGKTCLYERLQGKKFQPDYIPTEEIQVASIQWNYKNTDDVVKVEVWDIVDKGRKRTSQKFDGLKISEDMTPALDAEFLDVYKGTNGVILVMDITKNWTFNYVQKEILRVPLDIPVLVLGNHCDMGHHRTVSKEEIPFFIESLQRPIGSAQIRYAEASMSNGFGLKYVHKFFCLPFLQLQRESLIRQLERNERESELTSEELDLYQKGTDSDYNLFLDGLSKRRRQAADSAGVTSSQSCSNIVNGHIPSIILGQGLPIERSMSVQEIKTPQIPNKQRTDKPPPKNTTSEVAAQVVSSVEEFIPDGGYIDKSFLEDTNISNSPKIQINNEESDSDCDIGNNPLVTGFQDDVDPEDKPSQSSQKPTTEQDQEELEIPTSWVKSQLAISGRESPEGGEDLACADLLYAKQEKEAKKKSKKKVTKDKEDSSKSEKKKKKKKTSTDANNLEIFFSSHDDSYEAI